MPQDDDIEDEDESVEITKAEHDRLNAAARHGAALERDAEEGKAAKRELVFIKAGITPEALDGPLGKMFASSYDGDLELDAVKTAAAAVGLLGATKPDDGPEISEAETKVTEERQALATGATPVTDPPKPDPREGAVKAGMDALRAGAGEDVALGVGFAALREAAEAGDERVLVKP